MHIITERFTGRSNLLAAQSLMIASVSNWVTVLPVSQELY